MTTVTKNSPPHADLVANRGEQIYAEKIEHLVSLNHRGEYLVIDVDSEDYALAVTEEEALEKIEVRRPAGTFYLLRIGYAASLFMV